MDFMIGTRHLVLLLIMVGVVTSLTVGMVSSQQTAAQSVIYLPYSGTNQVAVSVLSVRPNAADRLGTRERIAREVGESPVIPRETAPTTPVDELPLVSNTTEDTDESVVIAPSVRFCSERDDRVSETFSPQGEIAVTVAEGARVITRTVSDAGVVEMLTFQVPEIPVITQEEQCIEDTIVGVGLDGRLVYAGIPFTSSREGLVGYARDGFGIFAAEENGGVVTTDDLDVCHGHTHAVVWDGSVRELYHYHVTSDAPYTLSCYRGTPVEG